MWVVNSMTDSVMFGVRFFLVIRMLRGGEGHCKLRRVFVGLGTYAGRSREGSSLTCLISRCLEVEEKLRACDGGQVRNRHGSIRCWASFILRLEFKSRQSKSSAVVQFLSCDLREARFGAWTPYDRAMTSRSEPDVRCSRFACRAHNVE
jgi:hypothetical protein